MNPEQIQQIVETIKTLNININDATTQKLVEVVLPVVKMYLIKEYVSMGLSWLAGIAVCFTLYKIVNLIIKQRSQ